MVILTQLIFEKIYFCKLPTLRLWMSYIQVLTGRFAVSDLLEFVTEVTNCKCRSTRTAFSHLRQKKYIKKAV